RARYYDTATGQWTTQDPIGFDAGSTNLREYAGNGAPNGTDPMGTEEELLDLHKLAHNGTSAVKGQNTAEEQLQLKLDLVASRHPGIYKDRGQFDLFVLGGIPENQQPLALKLWEEHRKAYSNGLDI